MKIKFEEYQHLEKIKGNRYNIVGSDPIFNLNLGAASLKLGTTNLF